MVAESFSETFRTEHRQVRGLLPEQAVVSILAARERAMDADLDLLGWASGVRDRAGIEWDSS